MGQFYEEQKDKSRNSRGILKETVENDLEVEEQEKNLFTVN